MSVTGHDFRSNFDLNLYPACKALLFIHLLYVSSFFCSILNPPSLSPINRDSQEKYFDLDYITSPSLSKVLPCPTVEASSRKIYHDESELIADVSITRPCSREVETSVEAPVCKMSVEKHEKSLDPSFESISLKISAGEPFINASSVKIIRDRGDVAMDVPHRKGILNELDTELPNRKVDKDTAGDLMDSHSRNVYRERCNLSLDVRKSLWTELEPSTDGLRKISRDMMGASMDSTSVKLARDNAEHLIEPRRMTRDSVGMSHDTGFKKLIRSKGECHLESSMTTLTKDKLAECGRISLKKISRDNLEYYTDTASIKMLPRETFEALRDTSTDLQEFGLEPLTCRGILRNEPEGSATSLRRRMPKISRDDASSSADSPAGSVSWDQADAPMELARQVKLREEFAASESSSLPCRTGQPDLMLTSQVPWKSSSDLYTVGPLSQLVYDGILEKACNSMASTPTNLSASTPNLPQSRKLAEVDSPVSPPKVVFASPCGDEKNKDKEKSKKSMKLKNLFKKKHESPSEKLQSGLQKL